MKILKQGRPPGEELFRGTCVHCKTQVEFKRIEGKYSVGDQRVGPSCDVNCPVCPQKITGYPVNQGVNNEKS